MKFSITALALAAFIGFCIAAPSAEPETNSHVSTDITSDLIPESDAAVAPRAKKSPEPEKPKTVCTEVTNREGISFMQCDDIDSELAASASYPSYSSPASSGSYAPSGGYGGGYGGGSSYSAPAQSYGKVIY